MTVQILMDLIGSYVSGSGASRLEIRKDFVRDSSFLIPNSS